MVIGVLEIELFIPDAQSLKDKRSAVKGLKDQLRHHFNVAVAELDPNVKWQRAAVGITTVSDDRQSVDGCLRQVVEWIRGNRFVELIRINQEIL